jgi:hypothetical protein
MYCELLKACGERPTLLQPTQTALDHIAITIAHLIIAERTPASPFTTTATRRNDRANAVHPQPMPDTLRVVGPVSANPAWASPCSPARSLNLNRLDERFELGRFVCRAWQQQGTEWQPIAIDQQVQFGAKATA